MASFSLFDVLDDPDHAECVNVLLGYAREEGFRRPIYQALLRPRIVPALGLDDRVDSYAIDILEATGAELRTLWEERRYRPLWERIGKIVFGPIRGERTFHSVTATMDPSTNSLHVQRCTLGPGERVYDEVCLIDMRDLADGRHWTELRRLLSHVEVHAVTATRNSQLTMDDLREARARVSSGTPQWQEYWRELRRRNLQAMEYGDQRIPEDPHGVAHFYDPQPENISTDRERRTKMSMEQFLQESAALIEEERQRHR